MELKEVFQYYPKAVNKYCQFAGKALQELQKKFLEQMPEGVESEVPVISEEIVRQYAETILVTNVRGLYSFFDQEGIIMELGVDRTTEPKFCYSFDTTNSDLFYSRDEAEIEGFKEAFKLLEEKINGTQQS